MKKKALIIGFGKSGKAAAKLAETKGFDVVVADRKAPLNVDYKYIPDHLIEDPQKYHTVIVSPGIPQDNILYSHMKKYHSNVVGEADFAFSHINQSCFAITGSNGKTTTTLFLEHLLKTSGKKAKAIGNVGFAFSSYALNPDPSEILICELSSFQLETLKGPYFDGGAILNITPDHLDRYENFLSYAKAKCNIFQTMKKHAKVVMKDKDVKSFHDYIDIQKVDTISENKDSSFEKIFEQEVLFDKATLKWLQKLSKYFHVSEADFISALKTFKKPKHRLEFVDKISGVRFYNDSKATNLESVIFALNHFSSPIHLIMGGKDKGFDFSILKNALSKNVVALYAIGEMQEKIDMSLNKHVKVLKVESLGPALKKAFESSKSGEIVLLSPGCSSYDQFEHFESRGDYFKKIVLELKQRNAL